MQVAMKTSIALYIARSTELVAGVLHSIRRAAILWTPYVFIRFLILLGEKRCLPVVSSR
jgi:hypothetical protein